MLIQSHQAEIIIAKRLIQESNDLTRVRVEPRSCDHGRRKNNTIALSARDVKTKLFFVCFLFSFVLDKTQKLSLLFK